MNGREETPQDLEEEIAVLSEGILRRVEYVRVQGQGALIFYFRDLTRGVVSRGGGELTIDFFQADGTRAKGTELDYRITNMSQQVFIADVAVKARSDEACRLMQAYLDHLRND